MSVRRDISPATNGGRRVSDVELTRASARHGASLSSSRAAITLEENRKLSATDDLTRAATGALRKHFPA